VSRSIPPTQFSLAIAAQVTILTKSLVLAAVWPSAAFAGRRQNPIEEAIADVYKITERTMLGRIERPGTVLVVPKEGVRADPPKSFMTPTTVRDGEVTRIGGGTVLDDGTEGKALALGDRVYLFDVRIKKRAVVPLTRTVETYDMLQDGKTIATSYEASVSVAFGRAYLESTDPAEIVMHIREFFLCENEAAAAETKSTELGQTPDGAKSILGQPSKVVALGAKTLFVYEDPKIVFLEIRMASAQ